MDALHPILPSLMVLGGLLASMPTVGWAHGTGLPRPIDVQIDPTTGEATLLWSTYGIMLPRGPFDWGWICEEVAGGDDIVTAVAGSPSGLMLMGTGAGLYVSEDLCEWSPHRDIPLDVDVLSLEGGANALYLAAYQPSETGGGSLFRSVDGGRSFAPYLEAVFGDNVGILGFVLDDAALPIVASVVEFEDDTRETYTQSLYWNIGGGEGEPLGESAWRRFPLDSSLGDQIIALGAVERGGEALGFGALRSGEGDVFVRIGTDGVIEPLVDLRPFRQFVADFEVGTTPGTLWMSAPEAGLFRSDDWGVTWGTYGPQSDGYCVVPRGNHVYQCADEWLDGAAVLKRGGALPNDIAFSFGWVRGPLECPEGSSVARICPEIWNEVQTLGFNAPTPTPTESPPPSGCGQASGSSAPQGSDGGGILGFGWAMVYLGLRQRRAAPSKKRAN